MGELSGERSGSRKSLKRLARREVAALSLAGLVLLLATAAALAVTGDLTQPAGTAGCVSETGTGPCADGHGLRYPDSVAVSADGKSVYAASDLSRAVVRFNRNTTTGAITQPAGTAGCISETGAGPCADGHGLNQPLSVAVSADGKSVYVGLALSATPWRVLTATRPPGRSPSPPGPPAASARPGRGPAPTAMGSTTRPRWR